jgi:hypothetical protein
MKRYLFLDDKRTPQEAFYYMSNNIYLQADFEWVKNYDEFVAFIDKFYWETLTIPDFISFDHDLGLEHYRDAFSEEIPYDSYSEKSGFHCAKWLVNFCLDHNINYIRFAVHSMNVVGSKNIASLINQFNNLNNG